MASLGTAEIEVTPVLNTTLLESAGWGNPRETALGYAIDSVRSFDSPPSPEHITARAEVFLAFLKGDDDG